MDNFSILIADDEPELLDKLTEYVKIFCDTVYTAIDGEEAYEVYKKNQPTLIFADINMPKLNGIELIGKIRETDKKTKIVILSAHTDTDYLLKAVELQIVSYLVKPVKMDELKAIIVKTVSELEEDSKVALNNDYIWVLNRKVLIYDSKQVDLSTYELLLIECLVNTKNQCVTYEELHNYIYDLNEFSKYALNSLVKRIRQKTKKEFITSCYKLGYKITSI